MREKDLWEERRKVEEQKGAERKKRIRTVGVCIGIAAVFFIGYVCGQKNSEIKLKKVEQEADAKVEAAKEEANSKIEAAKEEANSKIEACEQKIMKECDAQKYKLLEESFENLRRLKRGETLLEFSYQSLQLDSVEVPIINFFDDSLGEQEILEYLQTLKEIAEKYPLSLGINNSILNRLETCEVELKDKIDSAKTFQIIWDLRQQCEENQKLWKDK